MSDYWRGRNTKGKDGKDYYYDEGFWEQYDGRGRYFGGKYDYKPEPTVKKETEIYFSDKIQKFILENIYDSDEWYIFAYGKRETNKDMTTFTAIEYSLPLQKRSSSQVEVDQPFKALEHYEMCKKFPDLEYIGLIHSHGSMTAFFSKTDDEDIHDFKELCPDGFSIVFSMPGKKYTKTYDGHLTLSSLRFDVKVWDDKKFVDGETIICHNTVELDYTTCDMLVDNDEEFVQAKVYKRVLKCRKILSDSLESEHIEQLNRRQLEALLWAVGLNETERKNLSFVLKNGDWKEKVEEDEE